MALMVPNMPVTPLLPLTVTREVVRTMGLLTIGLEHGRLTLMVLMLRLITAWNVPNEQLELGNLHGRQLTNVGPPVVPDLLNTVLAGSGPRSTLRGRLDGAAIAVPATTDIFLPICCLCHRFGSYRS